MQELLTLITEIAKSGSNEEALIKMFGNRLRSLYGACAMGLLSKSGVSDTQCLLSVFVDENNTTVIPKVDGNIIDENLPRYTSTKLHRLLRANETCVLPGNDSLLTDIFDGMFGRYASVVSIPLYLPQGVSKWLLLLFLQPTTLSTVDIERIVLIATLAINLGVSTQNARHLQKANQWIENELSSVAKIQRQLLPQNLEDTVDIKIASRFAPYGRAGGDYYDITKLEPKVRHKSANSINNAWGFMIADASGHGSAAAVEIAMFDAILRTYPPDSDSGPAGVFNYANRHLFTRTVRGNFITAFVSSYMPQRDELSYCNAGHPPPILKTQIKPRDLIYLDEAAGIPLGVIPEGQWQNAKVTMHIGDTLVLYTDGVTEAVSESGQPFGRQRLESIIAESDNTPDCILKNIETALLAHQINMRQNDDQTIVIIQHKPI